ncbi:MAG: response regulator [Bacteroidota bacterium]
MIQSIIIDDEANSRTTLRNMLEQYCEDVEVVEMAGSVPEAVKKIQKTKPELIFLDIEMPVHNGFELFEFLPDLEAEVIFTTAYDQYAVKAFKFSAVDYLLKPIDLEELRAAIDRYRNKGQQKGSDSAKFQILQENIRSPFQKLGLPTVDGYYFIPLQEIIRCEADSNYTRFYSLSGEKILVPKTLKDYQTLLEEFGFLRVHRSHLINLTHIQKYTRTRIPSITMVDGTIIAVSLKKKDQLLSKLAGL